MPESQAEHPSTLLAKSWEGQVGSLPDNRDALIHTATVSHARHLHSDLFSRGSPNGIADLSLGPQALADPARVFQTHGQGPRRDQGPQVPGTVQLPDDRLPHRATAPARSPPRC